MKRHLVLLSVFVLVVAGGVAIAQLDGLVLQACALSNNGQLRLVASEDDCLPSEYFVSWNTEGAQGDPR